MKKTWVRLMDGRTDGRTDVQMKGRTDGRTDGQTSGRREGRTDRHHLLWRCVVASKKQADKPPFGFTATMVLRAP